MIFAQTTVTGPVVQGETIRVKNWDNRGGTGVWKIGPRGLGSENGPTHSADFHLESKIQGGKR